MTTPPGGWTGTEEPTADPPVTDPTEDGPADAAASDSPEPVPPQPPVVRHPGPPPPPTPVRSAPAAHAGRRSSVVAVVVLTVVLLGTGGLAWYLHDTARAWEGRAAEYLDVSLELGEELAGTRADLAGAQAELDAVRSQLGTLQTRLVELANEKARLGDDWEIQLQHLDYQERVSEAAGQVALALDQCVRGQNDLIGYLRNADDYDEAELDRFAVGVQELCDRATEANVSLQLELSR